MLPPKKTSRIIIHTFFKGFGLFSLGAFISAIGFFWGWYLIFHNNEIPGGGLGSALIFVVFPISLFQIELWTAILIDFCLLSPFLYAFVGYKIAISSAFIEIWIAHFSKPAEVLLERLFEHLSSKNAKWTQSLKDGEALKSHLLKAKQAFKNLPFFQRIVLSYGLKNIHLEKNLSYHSEKELAQMVGVKLNEAVQNSLSSSKQAFYVLIIIQLILMLVASLLH